MAPTRKNVSRGLGRVGDDPERTNQTQAKIKAPPADDAPAPRVRARQSLQQAEVDSQDPEVSNATQARVKRPDPERANKTQARRSPASRDEGESLADESGYHTGQSYQVDDDEQGLSRELSLEGDGLEALDPEVGSHTKMLKALVVEESTERGAAIDDDDEGADEQNATRAGPPLRLEITGGPDAGKKKKFKGVRMVIGRTPGVDFLLSDQSVSRRHVELIYGDDGVMLKDLGSGNGTKVNGVKVAEKKMEHGDEIAIGKTRIRFVDDMAAFKLAREENEKKEAEEKAAEAKAEAESPKTAAEIAAAEEARTEAGEESPAGKRDRSRPVRTARAAGGAEGSFAAKFRALPKPVRMGVVGVIAVVLMLFIVGIALKPPPPPPVDPGKMEADSKMQEARIAAREGDFQRVIDLVDAAEAKVPGIDRSKLGAQAREELAFMNELAEARKALSEKRFEDARKALARPTKGSLKSEEEKTRVLAELETAELAYKKEKIDELLAAGEVDAARAVLAELPLEMQAEPGQRIAAFERELAVQQAADAQDSVAAARNAAAAKKARREQEVQEAFIVVERKFAGSEWDRAASECNRVLDSFRSDRDIADKARRLQSLIPSFGRKYDEGMKKYRQGSKAQAAKPLRAAWQLFNQINLRANKFGQELQERLGDSAIVAGREALLREDLVVAYQMFGEAAKFDPSDSKARAGLDEVAAKADDLYHAAYMIRDRDQRDAVKKLQIVIQVTPPGSVTHVKAQNILSSNLQ